MYASAVFPKFLICSLLIAKLFFQCASRATKSSTFSATCTSNTGRPVSLAPAANTTRRKRPCPSSLTGFRQCWTWGGRRPSSTWTRYPGWPMRPCGLYRARNITTVRTRPLPPTFPGSFARAISGDVWRFKVMMKIAAGKKRRTVLAALRTTKHCLMKRLTPSKSLKTSRKKFNCWACHDDTPWRADHPANVRDFSCFVFCVKIVSVRCVSSSCTYLMLSTAFVCRTCSVVSFLKVERYAASNADFHG